MRERPAPLRHLGTELPYADGAEDEVLRTLREVRDVTSGSDELASRITSWPTRYHFSPERLTLLAPIVITRGMRVLDVGCGSGVLTRHLAERGAHVTGLEGSASRARAAAERCRGLDDVEILVGSLEDLTDGRFDLALVCGALEYSPSALGGDAGPTRFLSKVRSLVAPGGVLVLAIENQLGFGYTMGRPEDHHSQPWTGVGGYPAGGPRTWSRRELGAMASAAGFRQQRWFVPYPDYKVPRLVIDGEAVAAGSNADLVDGLVGHPLRDTDSWQATAGPVRAVHRELLDAGLGLELANSFLLVASSDDTALSSVTDPGWCWLASRGRLRRWRTRRTGTFDSSGSRILCTLQGAEARREGWLTQQLPEVDLVVDGRNLLRAVEDLMRIGDIDALTAVLRRWWTSCTIGAHPGDGQLPHPYLPTPAGALVAPGDALDVNLGNFILDRDGGVSRVDREWRANGGVDTDLILLRALHQLMVEVASDGTPHPWMDLDTIGDVVGKLLGLLKASDTLTRLDDYIEAEAQLQAIVRGGDDPTAVAEGLRASWAAPPGSMVEGVPLRAQLAHAWKTVQARDDELRLAWDQAARERDSAQAAWVEAQKARDSIVSALPAPPARDGRARGLLRVVRWAATGIRTEGLDSAMRGVYRRSPRAASMLASRRCGQVDDARDDLLRFSLDSPAHPVWVGRGTVVVVEGWSVHPVPVVRIEVALGDKVQEATLGLVRPDVSQWLTDLGAPISGSLTSGFQAWFDLPSGCGDSTLSMSATITLADGTVLTRTLNPLQTLAGHGDVSRRQAEWPATGPQVAICMATYDPDPRHFEEQVASIRAQTHENWVCVVSDDSSRPYRLEAIRQVLGDDERFILEQHDDRVGFYRNFERSLLMVPEDTELVALADQDDLWDPDKIERLLDHLDADTSLVYGDVRIVDDDQRLLAPSFWTARRNHHQRIDYVLLANTVTGAASLFRAELLQHILPFVGGGDGYFHDHWIACTALATGRIAFVDEPIQSYRQHAGNVIGHFDRDMVTHLPSLGRILRANAGSGALSAEELLRLNSIASADLRRLSLFARVLLLRTAEHMDRRTRVRLERVQQACEHTTVLALEAVRAWIGRRPNLRAEAYLLRGRLGRAVFDRVARNDERSLTLSLRDQALGGVAGELAGPVTSGVLPDTAILHSTQVLAEKLRPLELRIDPAAPRRINLLLPTIDPAIVFGGYLAKFQLAGALLRRGHRVRIVTVDRTDWQPDQWLEATRDGFPEVAEVLGSVELVNGSQRDPLEVSPEDSFVATTWWTAHLAALAMRELPGGRRFLYVIQEYEPATFPAGSYHAAALASYDLPHVALFSTDLLETFFAQERLGVFSEVPPGTGSSRSFRNAIHRYDPRDLELIRGRSGSRRLLVYTRPEAHAARNMFELAHLSLQEAARTGVLDDHWEITGIGAGAGGPSHLPIDGRQQLHMLPRADLLSYQRLLPSFDMGLALMATAHPSLVPLDMAAAGLITVTNTWGVKDAATLEALSPNLIAADPRPDAIAEALARAATQSDDVEARISGSSILWPSDWREVFDDELIDWIERAVVKT